ncbi:MAG: hypothetical protein ACYSOF_06660 [Planctomycetota bacterium]|jgi:hypothetical protein
MKRTTLILCGVMLFLLSHNATAILDDRGAPAWRGQPGTTLQQWDFIGPVPPEAPIEPEPGSFNPNGPVALFYYPGFTNGWMPEFEGHIGVLPLSGSIQIDIPNQRVPNPYKDIIVQLVWASETPRGNPFVDTANTKSTSSPTRILNRFGSVVRFWSTRSLSIPFAFPNRRR